MEGLGGVVRPIQRVDVVDTPTTSIKHPVL